MYIHKYIYVSFEDKEVCAMRKKKKTVNIANHYRCLVETMKFCV